MKLSDADIAYLRELQQNERHKRNYVKITVLLGLSQGISASVLSDLLGIDSSTVHRYVAYFKEVGMERYLENNYLGFWGKLSSVQLSALQQELTTNFYTDSHAIVEWIFCQFGIKYTPEGLVPLLHRLGFSYKKTKQVPCEADIEAQSKFVEKFNELLAELPEDELILFADAVHPQHNTRSTYGWIPTGESKEVLSVSGRNRININGVFNVQAPEEVLVVSAETINAQSTWELYQKVELNYPDKKKIYIICDNARYYKNKELNEKLKDSRIIQVFLPPYSPNLNLIERLWKFMRKKVIDNHFIRNFKEFKQNLLDFFDNIAQYKVELETLLTPKFHLPKSQTNFY